MALLRESKGGASAAHEIISALVAGGMDAIEAASLVARAAVEMTTPERKSTGALRQRRYRERNAGVTKRNESVTCDAKASQSVTNRNESVTSLRLANSDISYLLTSLEEKKESKKESKKERVPKKRNAPLPDDWQPSLRSHQVAEQHGVSTQVVEHIFRDYLKSSGKLYADYDAAFNNFLRNQQRFNGGRNGTSQPKSGGSLIAAIDRKLAEIEAEERADLAMHEGPVLRISTGSVR